VIRLARRLAYAPPILATLGKWVADTDNAEPPKSAIPMACQQAINR
jgi:hypothetical protein